MQPSLVAVVLPALERRHDVLAVTLPGHAGGPRLPEALSEDALPDASDRIDCPVRIVWGTEDRLLPWPASAARSRDSLPGADWVVLDEIGHCPQLDVPRSRRPS